MAFTVIDHEELSSNTSSVTLNDGGSNIPSSYAHLYLACSVRSNSGYRDNFKLWFNGDSSGGNYSRQELTAYGSPTALKDYGQHYIDLQHACAGSATEGSVFSQFHIWIMNYAETNNDKQALIEWSRPNWDSGVGGQQWGIGVAAGLRNTTGAITSVSCGAGNSFVSGSSFTLYGVSAPTLAATA